MISIKGVVTSFALALATVIFVDAMFLSVALQRGSALAAASEAFQRRLPNAAKSLLVIGDSTAVGTGAELPKETVAGRLVALLPEIEVVNLGKDGAKTGEIMAQLRAAPERAFDAILIQTGGNDILRFTDLDRLRRSATDVLRAAKAKSDYVVMMSTGDVGTAPAFPIPVDRIYSWRTRQVRALFLELAAREDIDYVDLYNPSAENPFHREPDRFYARDGLHPSGEGYRLWFEQLTAGSRIEAYLAGNRKR